MVEKYSEKLNREWKDVLIKIINSGISKEEFRVFIEEKQKKKQTIQPT